MSVGYGLGRLRLYHTISYHVISEIYSAPIAKRTWTIGALQKSAKCYYTEKNTKKSTDVESLTKIV